MSDRPRPKYGEYATPEEQSAASGVPHTPPPLAPPVPGTQIRTAAPPAGQVAAPRSWDRVLTTAFLAYGAVTLVYRFLTLDTTGQNLKEDLASIGFSGFNSIAQINAVALNAALVELIIFAVTVMIALRRLRSGKLTFFIPLIAWVLVGIAMAAIFMPIVVADPAYLTWAESFR